MKKRIFAFIAVIVAFASTISAQNPAMSYWGVRASYDITTSTKTTRIAQWRSGASVGIVYHGAFGSRWFIEPGMSLYYNPITLSGDLGYEKPAHDIRGRINNTGLCIPVNLGIDIFDNYKVRVMAYTGPKLYINISTKAKYTRYDPYSAPMEIIDKMKNTGMDIAWDLGFGANFNQKWHAHIEGTLGLSNWMNLDPMGGTQFNFRRAQISVGLGYNF